MDQVPQRLSRWWSGLDGRARRHVAVLGLLSAAYVGHYLVFCIPQPFFIEDSGISFAFARNLVGGEGLVAYPGGERVEGYSNALWTFLVALFYGLGVPAWTSSKVMGAVFGVLTLPFSYAIVRQARPDARSDVALLAPLMLAASPQFVVWNASGLENSLFCVLLASAMYRTLLEATGEQARRPWSALLYFLLTMTRPEGIMYAGIGFGVHAVGSLLRRRWLQPVAWLALFGVPWLAYNGWRYWYFAWEWTNTYYAKLGIGTRFKPFAWTGGGWKYIKNYFLFHRVVFLIPLLGIATLGLRRRWRLVGLVFLLLVLSVLVFWDGRQGIEALPKWWRPWQREWVDARVWAIGGTAALFGLGVPGRKGWLARGLLWATFSGTLFFILYAAGDWMSGHRWFNQVSVSLFPLLVVGLGDLLDDLRFTDWSPHRLVDRLPAWMRGAFTVRAAVLALGAGLWIGSEATWSYEFALSPETSVRDVHRRVRYMQWVQKRLDVDHIALMDVDMGAHLYFSGWDIVDFAGLVDVPFARHPGFDKKFVHQYVFEERKPEFAHVHAGWARTSKIPTHAEWKTDYFEIPGYPSGGRKLHVGNHIRKDLFITRADTRFTAGAKRFRGGVRLTRLDLPAPVVAAGGQLYIDSQWSAGFRKDGFRIVAFLDDGDGHRAAAVLPPGYDWYRPDQWKARERVAGRYRMDVPENLPVGHYRFGVVLLDEGTGQVLDLLGAEDFPVMEEPPAPETDEAEADTPAEPPPPDALEQAPAPASTPGSYVYLPGELLTDMTVEIADGDGALAAAEGKRAEALQRSADGDCDAAWPAWKNATRHISRDEAWDLDHAGEVKTAIAACYTERARAETDPDTRIADLVLARSYDHHLYALLELSRPLAQELDEQGQERMAEADWEGAYDAFSMAMKLDPTRSWTRRRAEEARDRRFDIHPAWRGEDWPGAAEE